MTPMASSSASTDSPVVSRGPPIPAIGSRKYPAPKPQLHPPVRQQVEAGGGAGQHGRRAAAAGTRRRGTTGSCRWPRPGGRAASRCRAGRGCTGGPGSRSDPAPAARRAAPSRTTVAAWEAGLGRKTPNVSSWPRSGMRVSLRVPVAAVLARPFAPTVGEVGPARWWSCATETRINPATGRQPAQLARNVSRGSQDLSNDSLDVSQGVRQTAPDLTNQDRGPFGW